MHIVFIEKGFCHENYCVDSKFWQVGILCLGKFSLVIPSTRKSNSFSEIVEKLLSIYFLNKYSHVSSLHFPHL